MSGALELSSVAIAIGGRPLFPALDLTVEAGAIVTLMGPSGAGKSTLLDLIGGHLDPAFSAAGRVKLDGRDIGILPPERRRVGVLFQDDLLFPHLSVGQNLGFGLDTAVRGRSARRAVIDQSLASAGLAGFADRDPATLSGGQRARVALLRTLLAAPRALLLDEPFGKLDRDLRVEVRRYVFAQALSRHIPVLLATHDVADAEAAGGPIVQLG